MRRISAFILSFIMLFSFTACKNSAAENNQPEIQSSPSAQNTPQPSAAVPAEPVYEKIIEISTAEELAAMSRDYGHNTEGYKNYLYVLTDDIDMSTVEDFVPIGMLPPYEPDPVEGYPDISYSAPNRKSTGFIATFDGQGHTVKNLTLNYRGNAQGKNGYGCLGFFAAVSDGGVVKNLNIENITINGIGANPWHSANCGGMAGYFAGYAENCHVSGKIDTISCGGGFVGRAGEDAKVYNCTADVDISGCWYTAGFVGYIESGDDLHFKDCASFGSMTAYIPSANKEDIWNVGGFGGMLSSGVYENCHAQTELIILDPAHSVGGMFAFADERNTEFINCTYHPAYTGNWDLLFSINHVTCNGNYGEYVFTPDESRSPYDFSRSTSAAVAGSDMELLAESKDKNYALYYGEKSGGTEIEILRREVIFHNRISGNQKGIGAVDIGNSKDSVNDEWGFFSNGDVYHFNFDRFDIYEKGMESSEPKFRLTDRLSLGEINGENISARYLHAIRRDPENLSFILVFSEVYSTPGTNIYTDDTETVMTANYQIGFMDKNGVLQDSIDTGCPVLCGDNGYYRYFRNVSMYLSGNQLNIEVNSRENGEVFTKGVLNFDTQGFITLKPAEYARKADAVSADGRYSLYNVSSGYYVFSAVLLDNTTCETICLGQSTDCGFLPDGNIYTKDYKDYRIFNLNGDCLFKLSDKFSFGENLTLSNIVKCDDGSYIFTYFDSTATHNPADETNFRAQSEKNAIIGDTYKLAITDTNAVVIKTIDTGKYVETYKNFFTGPSIQITDANTVLLVSENEYGKQYEIAVNIISGDCIYTDYR
ncbi:MAG: hypothetical protein IJN69_04855 [Oscillospiraceae bacterium]|nr:hypothetical protein [Oscillospiraceae bacterium]